MLGKDILEQLKSELETSPMITCFHCRSCCLALYLMHTHLVAKCRLCFAHRSFVQQPIHTKFCDVTERQKIVTTLFPFSFCFGSIWLFFWNTFLKKQQQNKKVRLFSYLVSVIYLIQKLCENIHSSNKYSDLEMLLLQFSDAQLKEKNLIGKLFIQINNLPTPKDLAIHIQQ